MSSGLLLLHVLSKRRKVYKDAGEQYLNQAWTLSDAQACI